MELRKFTSPEIVFGNESRKLAGQYVTNFGAHKVMVVTGPVVSKQPWFQDILMSLDEHGIDWIMDQRVSVNPRDFECHEIAKSYLEHKCDLILAVGGGSVLDCAKGVGVLASNGGEIAQYEGVDEICYPIPPLICIPSTSGSAAEISQFSIITHSETQHKMALVSKTLVPDLALMDPETTYSKGRDLTLDTGLDVLAHATEALASNASSPLTDLHAKEAIRLVMKWLPIAADEPLNTEAREGMLRASMNAGLAFSNASLGLIHAIAHAIGGRFDLVHGELNGLLLESVVRFNYQHAANVYQEIEHICSAVVQTYGNESLDEIYAQFIQSMRKNRPLSVQGADQQAMLEMIPWVLKDPCIATNPREVTEEDVKAIYDEIWK